MANPINYFDDLIRRLSKAGSAAVRHHSPGFDGHKNAFFPDGMPQDTQLWMIDPHEALSKMTYPPDLRRQAEARLEGSPYQTSPYSTHRKDLLYLYPTTSQLEDATAPWASQERAYQMRNRYILGMEGASQRLKDGNYKYHIAGAAANPLNAARHEIRHGIANPALEYVDASQGLGPYLRSDDEMLSRLGTMSDLHVERYGKLINSPKDAEQALVNYWYKNEDDIPTNVYMDDFENSKERRDKMTSMLQRLLTVPAVGAAASSQMDNSNQRR